MTHSRSAALHRLWPLLLALATLPVQASLQPVTLDFEAEWADLAPNTFVQINTLNPAPGGLHWGSGWFGQTTSPLQGSNNELRLGSGSFTVDNGGQPFYLDAVDFRSVTNGGHIEFDLVAVTYDAQQPGGAGAVVLFPLRVDGAPDVVLPALHFTTFTGTANLGPLLSFSFANFKAGGETTDRNRFVMDNLHLRMEPPAVVPEPASPVLMALGLALVGCARQRQRSRACGPESTRP
jgi:hypothetical protein